MGLDSKNSHAHPQRRKKMERVTRLELATSSLARRCSTTELHPRLEGVEIMAQPAHSATVNSADWRSARLMPDSLPLLHQSIILFRLHATNSAHSPRAAISFRSLSISSRTSRRQSPLLPRSTTGIRAFFLNRRTGTKSRDASRSLASIRSCFLTAPIAKAIR